MRKHRNMLDDWVAFVREARSTNSNVAKKLIVQKYHALTPLWRLVFDPQVTTGVTSGSILKHGKKKRKLDASKYDIMGLMTALTSRELTGHAAQDAIQAFLQLHPSDSDELIALFDGNPRLGIDLKQMNLALIAAGKPIVCPVFSVALAHPFTDARFTNVPGDVWYLSRKLDGIRVLIDTKTRIPYTRTGNIVQALVEPLKALKWPADCEGMLDGEMCIMEDDGVTENFTAAVSQLRQTKKNVDNFKYYVFDLVPRTDFDTGRGKEIWSIRMERARALITALGDPRVVAIETERYNADSLARWQARVVKENLEGLIVRRDAPYLGERTRDLLKLKAFQNLEAVVADLTTGTKQILNVDSGLMEDRKIMAAAVIVVDGSYVHVGSGFSNEQRIEFLEHPERLIGKTIEVQYFEKTTDKNGKPSLRFPTFKAIWGEHRDM